jgi:hypothetical protein
MLEFKECDGARVRRDAAYDGRFFTGVRTTGIYCRPVCPVRPAHSKNVEYYPSAAAAEAAGYRPCLRCRPETAPFSPAWKGSLASVERAMRRAQRCPCPSYPGAGYELIEGHRCASTAAASSRSIFAAVGARQPTSRPRTRSSNPVPSSGESANHRFRW